MIETMKKDFFEFLMKVKTLKPVSSETFPFFEVYMDQLLPIINAANFEKGLTSSMVNNYVKDGIISPPVGKRYSREQMMSLYVVSRTKSILPLPLLAEAIKDLGSNSRISEMFVHFFEKGQATNETIVRRLVKESETLNDDPESCARFALQLAGEANVLRLAAEALLANERIEGPKPNVDG